MDKQEGRLDTKWRRYARYNILSHGVVLGTLRGAMMDEALLVKLMLKESVQDQ